MMMLNQPLSERRQALAQQYFLTIKLELAEARAYWEGKRESPHFDSEVNTPEESILKCMCHYSNALWLIDKLEAQYKALSPQYEAFSFTGEEPWYAARWFLAAAANAVGFTIAN